MGVRPTLPMKKKMYPLREGALVPDTWKEQDEKSIQLQIERGTVRALIARVVARDEKW